MRLRAFAFGPVLAALMLAAGAAQGADALLVAAGAGYRKPVLALAERFTARTGIKVEASFGNMGQVQAQLRQNPAIALVAGDKAFLEPMQVFDGFAPLGQGKLALVAARGVPLKALSDLKDARFKRVALPDPVKAVYGKAATTCLARTGLDQALQGRLLPVATVPQVGAYVTAGEVDAGFVNRTEALALAARAGEALDAPAECYDPIEIVLGRVQGRAATPEAQAFIDFVATPEAREVLVQHGL
ncbi:molybdate ABC transporter substrate-binding protein [Comamonadaceae bacterium OH2545_COT-014]|nr:molybdate ABC transporter substrate-binding protein [Comamonadaceae bacterium OH2545_COT-014]